MRSRKWREKEFSTETLTQHEVDEIMAESEGYDRGEAPVGRQTQYAECLEDLAELQRRGHESSDMSFTLQPLSPDDENYEDIMENYEDITEKMSSNPTKPKYWFKEQGDHWYCSCGQLNKGDTCSNCGLERDLLRALFFLHEPGDEPGKYEGMVVPYTEVNLPKGLSPRTKLILAIAVIAILLAGTGLLSYFYIIKPSLEKEAAESAKAAADSMKAGIVLCSDGMDTFFRSSYITAGDGCCDNGEYEQAISFYGMAQSLHDSSEIAGKIDNAKFGYVKSHMSEGGDKFEKYLNELFDSNYSGIGDIYYKYYAWQAKIVANMSPDDYSTDISTASRNDIVYFHVTLTGGPPEKDIDVYYRAKYPSGHEEIQQIGTGWRSGSKGTVRCMYAVPLLGKEGKLTFSVYNKSNEELLGSDSITLSK